MKPRIIQVKCPHCQKRYMILRDLNRMFGALYKEKEWVCLSCPVWVWTEHWFDIFTQFEHLVRREDKK